MLCKLDDVMLLDALPNADFTEIREFAIMVGARQLICDASFGMELGFTPSVQGRVMVFYKNGTFLCPKHEQNPSLREVHALLCSCADENFVPPEFEPFYLDMSHRIRHGAALTAGIRCDNGLAACAMCAAKTEHTALLSGVAVLPDFRRQGLGASVVRALISELKQSAVYLFRAENENKAFYEKLGFADCGAFSEFMLDGGSL